MFEIKHAVRPFAALLCAASILLGASSMAATGANAPALQEVAHFDHQVTGITASPNGRIFVNFPRWTEDNAISVAELGRDGTLKPYPDDDWNAWRNAKMSQLSPKTHFVCVQSVVADKQGNLWVVDPAAPGNDKVVEGGAKLVKIDLATNKVVKTYGFDDSIAPKDSYLNDVRIAPDGSYAYMTDSGKGAIVVVDLKTGGVRRLLDGDKSTQFEKEVVIKTDGQPLRRPDGRGPMFNADGIALSPNGQYLYYQALTGKTLYRIPTAALINENLQPRDVAQQVEKLDETGPADGLWMDENGRLYLSDMQSDAVKYLDHLDQNHSGGLREADAIQTTVQDKRLRWPDTFSEGPDGTIYVTTSHIQDSPWFKPGAPNAVKTELWKIAPQRK